MTEAELTHLATRALVGLGVAYGDAADAARILVLGDLFGHHTHGVSRLESYGERVEIGGIDPRAIVLIERVAPAIAKVDGANALGPVVGMRALEAAMEGARQFGVASPSPATISARSAPARAWGLRADPAFDAAGRSRQAGARAGGTRDEQPRAPAARGHRDR